jgi:hypothetical protein
MPAAPSVHGGWRASSGRLDETCRMDELGLPVADSWFSVQQVADGITLITEPYLDSWSARISITSMDLRLI